MRNYSFFSFLMKSKCKKNKRFLEINLKIMYPTYFSIGPILLIIPSISEVYKSTEGLFV